MKNFFKSQKGVNLISLSIAVIMILIITNVILYNVKNNLGVEKLQNMQADIENLRDKISTFYAQNGKIPASIEYTNIGHIESAGLISIEVDTGKFYVIDLSAIDNLTLNYGEDYKKIKSGEASTSEQINALVDLYIINETSHNIFFVRGIEYDNEWFYTDYTSDDVDTKAVNLVDTNAIASWSPAYDKTAIYKDENGDTATIPAGFQVSRKTGENTINEGLVVRGPDESEFVWVPVDKTTFDTKFKRTEGYSNNGSLQSYINTSGEAGADGNNSYLQANGLDESEETKAEAIKMYSSVKTYGGFYIGRYEAGKETINGVEKVVSKKNVRAYNLIPWSSSTTTNTDTGGAVEKARGMVVANNYTSVTSTLCYGVQWDATLNFIDSDYITNQTSEKKPNCNNDSYLVNSAGKGWYSDNYYTDSTYTGKEVDSQMSNKVKNIYDMAGNLAEWTMEVSNTNERLTRGGSFLDSGSTNPASSRKGFSQDSPHEGRGFRVTLYLNE